MADTVRTIGTGGDYADPILWAAAQGAVDDGNRQVGVMLNDIVINALFRPNQSFPNGGLLRGNITVTGEAGVGVTLANLASTRYCLAPSSNLNFEDFYASDGGISKTTTFQNLAGSEFTRFISADVVSGGTINPLINSISTTLTNCVVYSVVQNNSSVAGSVTLNNSLVMDRIIARANNLLTFASSISLAADWYLGRPSDSGAESLVTNSRILQDAPADEFGPGSTGNIVNYDATNDFVDLASGDYRISASSPLHALNIGPFFETSGGSGNDVSITSIMPSMTSALSANYTIPSQSASIASVMPSMQSSIAANYTIPGNSASIVSVMPSMSSSITVTQAVPEYSASISSTMPSMVSAINISNLPPGNNSSITSIMPSMVSAISISKTNPQYAASIDSIMPNMVSSVSLSINNPGNSASIESIMPSMTSSLTLTVDEPVSLSLSISSTMPSMTSAISILNGDIQAIQNIDISFANNGISVEYIQSNINISYGE